MDGLSSSASFSYHNQQQSTANSRVVTQKLCAMFIAPGAKESEIAKYIFEQFGSNYKLADASLKKACQTLLANAYVDPSRIAITKVLTKYKALCKQEKAATSLPAPPVSRKKLEYEKLTVIRIMSEETGSVLDKVKEASIYLSAAGVSRKDALEMIKNTSQQLLDLNLLKRANLPPKENIEATIKEVYRHPESYVMENWLSKSIDPALSIAQTLPVEKLRENAWFIENRSDLVQMEKFDGIYAILKPEDLNISVPDPTQIADYLGEMDAARRTPSDKPDFVPEFYAPMLLPEEWAARHFKPQGGAKNPESIEGNVLVMNCGWFNIFPTGEGSLDTKDRINPHTATGSFPLGPLVVGDKVLADHTLTDKGQALDAIIFRDGIPSIQTAKELAENPEVYQPHKGQSLFVINGFKILDNEQIIATPPNNNPDAQMPRSGIGIREDGSLVFCVLTTGLREEGITAKEFANFFKSLGCVSAINLDNSGSAAMAVVGRQNILDAHAIGATTTAGSDIAKDEKGKERKGRKNRPIPLALVISPKPAKAKPSEL